MHFSKHHRQHLQKQARHLTTGLSAPYWAIFCSIHSRRTRSILTMARRREPNARVPKWYLTTR